SWYLEPEPATTSEAQSVVADAAELIVPSEDDRKVVEAALLRLLDDPDFDTFGSGRSGPVLLDLRTPPRMGCIDEPQVRADLWHKHDVPDEMIEALRLRNEKPGTIAYETKRASWSGVAFERRIVVADLEPVWKQRSLSAFEDAFPAARGW